MAGELEAADYVVSTARKQKEMDAGAPLSVLSFSLELQLRDEFLHLETPA